VPAALRIQAAGSIEAINRKNHAATMSIYSQSPSLVPASSSVGGAKRQQQQTRKRAAKYFESKQSLLNTSSSSSSSFSSSSAGVLSLTCKAAECESLSEFSAAANWYSAALAFLEAEDPNRLDLAPFMRANLGIGDNCKKVRRLADAERHYAAAVALAKQNSDSKGLEESAQKLGACLVEQSEEMEREGREQEAYLALQRGILSLQEAVDGAAGGAKSTLDSLGSTEQLLAADRRHAPAANAGKKREAAAKKKRLPAAGASLAPSSSSSSASLLSVSADRPSWRPSGKPKKNHRDVREREKEERQKREGGTKRNGEH